MENDVKKVNVDYNFLKALLKENTVRVNVKESFTIITFFSNHTVITSNYRENRFGKFKNIVDATEELLRLANKNENFDANEFYYQKKEGEWYRLERFSSEDLSFQVQ